MLYNSVTSVNHSTILVHLKGCGIRPLPPEDLLNPLDCLTDCNRGVIPFPSGSR